MNERNDIMADVARFIHAIEREDDHTARAAGVNIIGNALCDLRRIAAASERQAAALEKQAEALGAIASAAQYWQYSN